MLKVFSKNGKILEPVAFSRRFLNALFDIEKNNSNEKFTYLQKEYLKNHVTNSDLQTATILHKFCNAITGEIDGVSLADIHSRIIEKYHEPISFTQFMTSIRKFELHQLIEVKKGVSGNTRLYNIKLNYFFDELTNKIADYFLLHPVVFTSEFSHLSVGAKKLVYSIYSQQSYTHKKPLMRALESSHIHNQFAGLKTFLKREQGADIAKIVNEVAKLTYRNKPVFEIASLKKGLNGKYETAKFFISKDFLVKHNPGEKYRELIKTRMVYQRKAQLIKKYLEYFGLGEILVLQDGNLFAQIVRYFKQTSYRVIHYVIKRLKEYVQKNGKFPNNILEYVQSWSKSRLAPMVISLAEKYKLYDCIVYQAQNEEEKEEAIFTFASKLSSYSKKELSRLFSTVYEKLSSITKHPRSAYHVYKELDAFEGIQEIREYAYKNHKAIVDYIALEESLVRQLYIFDKIDIDEAKERVKRIPNESVATVMSYILKKNFTFADYVLQFAD